jgi:hypothetical protein
MKTPKKPVDKRASAYPYPLLSDHGIGHDIIRAGLHKRSDRECLEAATLLRNYGNLTKGSGIKIAEMSIALRDSSLILDKIEPGLRERFADHPQLPQLLEVHALMVEEYVRCANTPHSERI